jgi:hypothetical protein
MYKLLLTMWIGISTIPLAGWIARSRRSFAAWPVGAQGGKVCGLVQFFRRVCRKQQKTVRGSGALPVVSSDQPSSRKEFPGGVCRLD